VLNVFSCPDTNPLIDHLARASVAGKKNPLEPFDCVLLTVGMDKWLKQEIAMRVGISANIETPMLSRFIWDLLNSVVLSDKHWALNKDSMQLIIYDVIRDGGWHDLSHYLSAHDSDADHLALAGKIADTFDAYTFYRPMWLNHWSSGKDTLLGSANDEITIPEAQAWQPKMWREIQRQTASIDLISDRGELIESLKRHMAAGTLPTSKLPPQITIFGVSQIPQVFLDILVGLADYIDVNLYWLNPALGYWADNVSTKTFMKAVAAGKVSDHMEIGNPLLSSLGASGKAFFSQLIDANATITELAPEFSDSATLLGLTKNAIFEASTYGKDSRPLVDSNDSSFVIASTHGALREIEALKDHLFKLFETIPDLLPHEIAVMSPNIADYAPFIHQVFGDMRLPYSVSDVTVMDSNPIFRLVKALLAINDRRFTVLECSELLTSVSVLAKYDLSPEMANTLMDVAYRNNVRWGLTASTIGPVEHNNTWEDGAQRIIAGNSLGAEHAVKGVYPFLLSSSDAREYSKVAAFLDDLSDWAEISSTARPLSEWIALLTNTIAVLVDETVEPDALIIIYDTLSTLANSAETLSLSRPVDIGFLNKALTASFSETTVRSRFLAGAINFSNCVPLRSIPFRVIALLGMNDTEFPRRVINSGLDLLASNHRPGDRDPRNEDRYFALESILLANDAFYMSYQGRNPKSNEERAPSVVIQEIRRFLLTQFIVAGTEYMPVGDQMGTAYGQFNVHHHLQPFNPGYFINKTTYSTEWTEVSKAISASARQEISPVLTGCAINQEMIPDLITRANLHQAMTSPCELFLRTRYGARLSKTQNGIETLEPMSADALQIYKTKARAADWLAADRKIGVWHARELASGAHPVGALTSSTLFRGSSVADQIQSRLVEYGPLLEKAVDMSIGHAGLTLHISTTIGGITEDGILVHYTVGSANPKRLLALWIDAVIAKYAGLCAEAVILSIEGDRVKVQELTDFGSEADFHTVIGNYLTALAAPQAFTPDIAFQRMALMSKNKRVEDIYDMVKTEWDGAYKYGKRENGIKLEPSIARCFSTFDAYYANLVENIDFTLGSFTLEKLRTLS
jgi:exodeoxyribonuclease V gamma subunit